MFNRELISAVREMMERHWNVYEMSCKMKMDPATIQAVVDFINNMLT